MIYTRPEATFEVTVMGLPPNLAGTLGVRIIDPPGNNDVLARTTSGIIEAPPASGIYTVELTAPVAGAYQVVWDTGGGTPEFISENLIVADDIPPFLPPADGYASLGQVFERNTGRRFSATSQPNIESVRSFIQQTAGVINGILNERSYRVPVPTSAVDAWIVLAHYNAIGAAALVEEAAPTSDRRKEAREAWESAQEMLRSGAIQLPDAPINENNDMPAGGFSPTAMFGNDMEF